MTLEKQVALIPREISLTAEHLPIIEWAFKYGVKAHRLFDGEGWSAMFPAQSSSFSNVHALGPTLLHCLEDLFYCDETAVQVDDGQEPIV